MPASTSYIVRNGSRGLKSLSRLSVKGLMEELNEAESAGDVHMTKALLAKLSDRKSIPVKFLRFYENSRPTYIGTWSRLSTTVGPRTPFAKDHSLDYSYDSGEEWIEEEGEADDLGSLDGEEEDKEEDEDDENDWMVDDDEVDEGGLVNDDEEELDPLGFPLTNTLGKRKATTHNQRLSKRRKVVPLKPDCKGPHWETTLGETQVPSFSRYAIRMLNGERATHAY